MPKYKGICLDRDKEINRYLNLAKIESEIKYAKEHGVPLCIGKFKYIADLDNAFLFKDVVKAIYATLKFPPFWYDDKDSFIVIFRRNKLHESKNLLKKMQIYLKNRFDIHIDRVALSELSKEDSIEDILNRVEKYFIVSKRLPEGKIIYGTRNFDFYDPFKRDETLRILFKDNSRVWLYNIYKGIPIKEEGFVELYDQDKIIIRTSKKELKYLKRFEEFLYIKHLGFPNIIKAKIQKIDFENSTVTVDELEIQDDSAVERENIRISPEKSIHIMIEFKDKIISDGIIKSIAVDSISVIVKKERIPLLKRFKNQELTLKFNLFTKENSAVDKIIAKARIVNFITDEVVFILTPNSIIQQKILRYIVSMKKQILQTLQLRLR